MEVNLPWNEDLGGYLDVALTLKIHIQQVRIQSLYPSVQDYHIESTTSGLGNRKEKELGQKSKRLSF